MIIYEELHKKYSFSSTQKEIIKIVGRNKVVLEIGSSTGYMTGAFLDNGCTVDVVEISEEAISKVPKSARRIINMSIEDDNVDDLLGNYDFIIMADVLEHLVFPDRVLKKLINISTTDTKLIISLPNIASWVMRKQLFFNGDFNYQESGLLDKTHLHFYTVNTLPGILEENGWKTEKVTGTITRIPLEGAISKIPILGWIFEKFIYQGLVEKYKNLSYYHFLVVASKRGK